MYNLAEINMAFLGKIIINFKAKLLKFIVKSNQRTLDYKSNNDTNVDTVTKSGTH